MNIALLVLVLLLLACQATTAVGRVNSQGTVQAEDRKKENHNREQKGVRDTERERGSRMAR